MRKKIIFLFWIIIPIFSLSTAAIAAFNMIYETGTEKEVFVTINDVRDCNKIPTSDEAFFTCVIRSVLLTPTSIDCQLLIQTGGEKICEATKNLIFNKKHAISLEICKDSGRARGFYCLTRIAELRRDSSLCEFIPSSVQDYIGCYYTLAQTMQDETLCNRSGAQDICRGEIYAKSGWGPLALSIFITSTFFFLVYIWLLKKYWLKTTVTQKGVLIGFTAGLIGIYFSVNTILGTISDFFTELFAFFAAPLFILLSTLGLSSMELAKNDIAISTGYHLPFRFVPVLLISTVSISIILGCVAKSVSIIKNDQLGLRKYIYSALLLLLSIGFFLLTAFEMILDYFSGFA